jgi:transcriptional regulator with XRE-family HTH domain
MEPKNFLKAQRVLVGMTQTEVAEHIGVTKGAVIRWEKDIGGISARNLAALADLFGVSCDYLVGRSEARK